MLAIINLRILSYSNQHVPSSSSRIASELLPMNALVDGQVCMGIRMSAMQRAENALIFWLTLFVPKQRLLLLPFAGNPQDLADGPMRRVGPIHCGSMQMYAINW
jgi:hypothetical protein